MLVFISCFGLWNIFLTFVITFGEFSCLFQMYYFCNSNNWTFYHRSVTLVCSHSDLVPLYDLTSHGSVIKKRFRVKTWKSYISVVSVTTALEYRIRCKYIIVMVIFWILFTIIDWLYWGDDASWFFVVRMIFVTCFFFFIEGKKKRKQSLGISLTTSFVNEMTPCLKSSAFGTLSSPCQLVML